MKKFILGFILFALIAVVFLFLTDFSLVKKLIGYNLPETTNIPVVSPDSKDSKDGLGFLSVPDGFKISIAAKD